MQRSKILELGCGQGPLLAELERNGYRNIVGIDGSKCQVENSFSPAVILGDIFTYLEGQDDGTLDCVITLDLIEHLELSEIRTISTEIKRCLAAGGVWIIRVPNANGINGSGLRYADLSHECAFTDASIRQLADLTGYATELIREDIFPIYGPISGLRCIVWRIVRSFFTLTRMSETGEFRNVILSRNLLAVLKKR
jgi:SAM-dependent methyltransferase